MHQPGHASASAKTLDGLTRARPVPDAEQRRGSGQPVRHQYLDHLAVVRSARESGGRSPSTIPATSSRRRNSGSDRQSAQALGLDGLNHDLHARAFRPP